MITSFRKLLECVCICFGLLILSSCKWGTIEPQAFRGPEGKAAFSMRCSGMGRSIALCYQKASELCPNGYDVIERSSGTIAVGTIIAPKEGMVIQCR